MFGIELLANLITEPGMGGTDVIDYIEQSGIDTFGI